MAVLSEVVSELHLCYGCMKGWIRYGMSTPSTCAVCGNPGVLYYRHRATTPIVEFNKQLDSLQRYIDGKITMVAEPMEEMDFSPLQAVIDNQKGVIEELQERIEELENKVTELESDILDRNDALSQIERLATLYV